MAAGIEAAIFVIVGGRGDLARRKLLPAVARLVAHRAIQKQFHVLAVGRKDYTDEDYREWAREGLELAGLPAEDIAQWCRECLHFQSSSDDAGGWKAVEDKINQIESQHGLPGNRVFYLAIPPRAVPGVIEGLGGVGLNVGPGYTRLVVEKPFGRDLESAQELNQAVHEHFDERQVYRIDHYLGKETVQNLLVFRFANVLFESSWNREHVKSVEITVAESLGLEGRAGYYDNSGAMRDMIQNHVTQVMSLVAMEPPVKLDADSIRNEKVKVLRSVLPISPDDVVFGQYAGGTVDDEIVESYVEEPDVADDSATETSVALRLYIDNWRWQGVPFYLRTGKRFPERLTQIAVRFREPPVSLFDPGAASEVRSDAIIITLQPDEGFELYFDVKTPAADMQLKTLPLEFRYADEFGTLPGAYETLVEDILMGDQTLFVRADEVEEAWRLYQPILDNPPVPERYASGTWGPPRSLSLPHSTGDHWWVDD